MNDMAAIDIFIRKRRPSPFQIKAAIAMGMLKQSVFHTIAADTIHDVIIYGELWQSLLL